jgi:predicted acetyltransferase
VTYQFRTATGADWDEIARLMFDAFHDDPDDAAIAIEGSVFEPERSVVATIDGTIAGHAASFTRDLTVPGGTVAAAHVTMVSVGPTHRRRGLLTTMIETLHADADARHEPIAVLWASEGKIYQRYGYGLAAHEVTIEGRSADIAWLNPPEPDGGQLRAVPLTAVDDFRSVYESVRTTRTGWSTRDDRWWGYVLSDPPTRRRGATAVKAVLHVGADGTADGYLLWRVKAEPDGFGSSGRVLVNELVAANPVAYRALWTFVFSMDLARNFRYTYAAVDEPLPLMLTEPRRLNDKTSDALWVRVLDVPKALEARRYAAPVDVVLEVTDARIPVNNGRWHLIASPDKSVCTATDAPADLTIEVSALGAAYLGGTSLTTLAAAGRVGEARAGTLATASAAFAWTHAPSAIEIF